MTKEAILDTIWSRMEERGDFPTMERDLSSIVDAMKNSEASANELAQVVLSDFSLTQKVLRLANSAMYSAFGGGVTTVTRAVSVLGVDAIGYLAMGLQMLDDFVGIAQGRAAAKDELRRTQVASTFTRHVTLSRGVRETEEAVICTMMRHVARLLVVFYCPEEWQRIEEIVQRTGCGISFACEEVLGISLEGIALESARRWGLPNAIAQSMHPPRLSTDTPLTNHGDWLKAVAMVSTEVAEILDGEPDLQCATQKISAYADWLGIDPHQLQTALQSAAEHSGRLRAGSNILGETPENDVLDLRSQLACRLLEVRAVAPSMDVNTLTPLTLETLMHALQLHRAIGFFVNRASKRYEARVGFGADVSAMLPRLSFEQEFVPDVFHIASTQRIVTFVADARAKALYQRLPGWYHAELSDARSFMLVPIHLRGRCIGMLYGDWGRTPHEELDDTVLGSVFRFGEEIAKGFERLILSATA